MILITSGCSFSECISDYINTWPRHLTKALNAVHISCGLGSQGNGLISRKLLYQVHTALKSHNAEDIIVGVMWSGTSRWECYQEPRPVFDKNTDGWQRNPTDVVDNSHGGWIIANHWWKHPVSDTYYENYYDPVYSQIQTLEHVLRVQLYLKQHNIKYFMSSMNAEVFPDDLLQNPECRHLTEMIDWTSFLPCKGEHEWCRDNSAYSFKPNDDHPTSEMHSEFVDRVIMPWLAAQGYLDNATAIL
jgi:hypothetical protein